MPMFVGPSFGASCFLPQKVGPFVDALFGPVQRLEFSFQNVTVRHEWATPADVLPSLQGFSLGFGHELPKNGKLQGLLPRVHVL